MVKLGHFDLQELILLDRTFLCLLELAPQPIYQTLELVSLLVSAGLEAIEGLIESLDLLTLFNAQLQ